MTKLLEQIVADELRQVYGRVRDAACFPEGDINIIINETCSAIISIYMRKRIRGTKILHSDTMDRYKTELEEARLQVDRELRDLYFLHQQRWKLARIEYPALSLIISEELGRKKIPYLFRTNMDENILTVQVVKEHFFEIPITLENVEKATRLINYFINRPDCAQEELPEIRRRRSPRLAEEWTKVATIP